MRQTVLYANPHLVCEACNNRAAGFLDGDGPPTNVPCGHNADFYSACPSWGPVDPCTCTPRHTAN